MPAVAVIRDTHSSKVKFEEPIGFVAGFIKG